MLKLRLSRLSAQIKIMILIFNNPFFRATHAVALESVQHLSVCSDQTDLISKVIDCDRRRTVESPYKVCFPQTDFVLLGVFIVNLTEKYVVSRFDCTAFFIWVALFFVKDQRFTFDWTWFVFYRSLYQEFVPH